MKTENIHWLGHDSFRIEDQGKNIYIDPWKLSSKAVPADYILVTHSHYDHFSKADIDKIKIPQTKLVGPTDVVKQLGSNAIALTPHQEIKLDQLSIRAVPAYNIGKKFHPRENNWIGFVITLSDGTKIYHAGDTDFIPEMKRLKVDIALLPVSGTYVMTADEAIEAANAFQPKIVIPMHFGDIVGDQHDAEKFKAGFSGQTIIKPIER
ncbi:MAG: MBL fold metallo-hydrolase [candidate division KSB1 bacterium]|nr:MBL fold metallo-hydrolase [candidate division KSB1 bacterium]MDZ7335234.1 MBL fold metallo-hydrolase [candidate division KSB1 bacterium]MDZ7359091.1 MBL fold metallo-hydrolase [candidate division KSB1 bacterium]MDZ7401411.1 MBL fold metallo-hydrolase [candidate division KSB1 bacterium]